MPNTEPASSLPVHNLSYMLCLSYWWLEGANSRYNAGMQLLQSLKKFKTTTPYMSNEQHIYTNNSTAQVILIFY